MEPTDVYSCPPQEGGYSPRGASYRRIEGGRRTPNGVPERRAELHARGLATRAAAAKRLLAV